MAYLIIERFEREICSALTAGNLKTAVEMANDLLRNYIEETGYYQAPILNEAVEQEGFVWATEKSPHAYSRLNDENWDVFVVCIDKVPFEYTIAVFDEDNLTLFEGHAGRSDAIAAANTLLVEHVKSIGYEEDHDDDGGKSEDWGYANEEHGEPLAWCNLGGRNWDAYVLKINN